MGKNMLIDSLENLKSYSQIIEAIEEKKVPISLHGLAGENISHISYAINQHLKKQVLIITYDDLRAKSIHEDLNFYNKAGSEIFPTRDIVFYDVDAFSHDISNQRLKTLSRLSKGEDITVVTPIRAILNKIISPISLINNTIELEIGKVIDLEEMSKKFIVQGYERVEMIEGKGQFAIRGGIIDIFPANLDNPIRAEMFDDEVDSIRIFDIKNQRSIENIDCIQIPPVREILIEEDYREKIVKEIENDLKLSINKLQQKESLNDILEKLEEKFTYYIERINSNLNISNLDLILPYITQDVSNVLNYLKKDAVVVLDEPQRIEENISDFKDEFIQKYINLFEAGEVLSRQTEIFYTFDDIVDSINEKDVITSTNLLKNTNLFKPKTIVSFAVRGMQSFHNKLDILVDDLNHYKYRGYKVIILCGLEERGERLLKDLKDKGVECSFVDDMNREIQSGQVFITPGSISAGFEYTALKLVIINDKEIFGTNKKKRKFKSRKDSRPISSFTDLKLGDYVVHESHGIGKYIGIDQLNVQGIKKDYLSIEYSGDDKLYVPIDQMNLIQKYIGSDAASPKVSKLGSTEWIKTKTKVKKSIEDMAKDLIKLYATRETIKGHKYSEDTPWQKQFEDAFPYEETDDQLKSVEEIKKDMEKAKPMDRLLCGDVGYGKTEVALRAIFKAVMEGKQAAILVPTTILAQQHYNTLVERFAEFPVKIDMLSRFRTPTQQKKIMNDLKIGNLDVIVGTHRILSKDVKFKDLGLLVIDEEQRFGVKHKEAIKIFKESIDVLTLTATPIPRTLHMSLVGIRDMSVLEEPPEERYPIQTYVVEYNEQMVRDAIIKELSREGQVYILYNRVQTINEFSARIQKLVPEARIAIAHGQMGERELEKVMIEFFEGEYDILICTTIIETGLDIPNVNTIMIQDADKMGLSQLYQLRGRVGRSNRIAFSYFMYERNKVLTEVAEKRLRAIKEFTEFGSGFKIAMRDLEIRGTGNLLGSEQHGQMSAIGYDLYVKYLEQAVKRLSGDEKVEEVETSIEINVDAYIPDRYIENEEQKIEVYKKISAVNSRSDYSDILEEIIDRYGDVPKQVVKLLNIAYIKSLASKVNISTIKQISNIIKIEFIDNIYMASEFMDELVNRFGKKIELDLSRKPGIKYKLKGEDQEDTLGELEDLVGKINSIVNIQKKD